MATYLGGHDDLNKSLKGSLEIYSDGVEFCVLGPKFIIPAPEIRKATISCTFEIRENPEWVASCFKGTLPKDEGKATIGTKKKNKIVIYYMHEGALGHCVFNADNQLSAEVDAVKAEGFIKNLILN